MLAYRRQTGVHRGRLSEFQPATDLLPKPQRFERFGSWSLPSLLRAGGRKNIVAGFCHQPNEGFKRVGLSPKAYGPRKLMKTRSGLRSDWAGSGEIASAVEMSRP